jgi:fucose permease
MIMGLVANALMPVTYGLIAEHTGMRAAYWILLPCFLDIIFYAFQGYKLRNWSGRKAEVVSGSKNLVVENE